MLTFIPLYYSFIIQTISELMSYASPWLSAGLVKVLKYVFVLEDLIALCIKLSMVSALTVTEKMEVKLRG